MKNKFYLLLLTLVCVFTSFFGYGCIVKDVDVAIPDIKTLIEHNKIEELMDNYSNITIETAYTVDSVDYDLKQYFYKIDENIVMDSIKKYADNTEMQSDRGQVSYISENDELSLLIYEQEQEHVEYFESMQDSKLVGDIYIEDKCYVANVWCDVNDYMKDSVGIYYTIWFNQTTLNATKLTSTMYDEDLEVSVSLEATFRYDYTQYQNEYNAYNLHVNSANPITVDFVFNYDLENQTSLIINTDKYATFNVLNEKFENYGVYESPRHVQSIDNFLGLNGSTITLYVSELKPAISFECDFTSEHYDLINTLLDDLREYGLNGDIEGFDKTYDQVSFYFDYLYSQENKFKIEYYSNPDEESANAYSFIINSFNTLATKYNELFVELSKDSPIRDYIFAGYTEEEIEALQKDNSLLGELQGQVNNLKIEYQQLDQGADNYEDMADALYLEMSKINHQIAVLNGYDNYYDYASEVIYNRYYTKEDREKMREYVQIYILPLLEKVVQYYRYYDDSLSIEESNYVYDLVDGRLPNYPEFNDYMYGYIDTYKDYSVYDHMMSAFIDNAIVASTNKSSLGTAFSSWDPIYQHSVIYSSYYYNSLFTIIHELGHYVSFYHYDFYSIGYDIAEIHSQANEWILTYYLRDFITSNMWNTLVMDIAASNIETILVGTFLDEFEETFFSAIAENNDLTVSDMREILNNVVNKYQTSDGFGMDEDSAYLYIRGFAVENPAYYLNYATSQIASLSFAQIADVYGYDEAQSRYVDLLANVDSTLNFKELVEELDLLSPFEEETYIKLSEMFYRGDVEFDFARKDVIYAEGDEIKPLFNISEDNTLINYNEDGKVLMVFFTNDYGELLFTLLFGTMMGNLRSLSADELINWYKENGDEVTNWDTRLNQLLGFNENESSLGFVGLWVDAEDINRLAYQTDISKQLTSKDLVSDESGNYSSMNDSVEKDILELRDENLNYAGNTLYTLLGYTYDLASEDEYGLSEFLILEGSDVEFEFAFNSAEGLVEWLEEQI